VTTGRWGAGSTPHRAQSMILRSRSDHPWMSCQGSLALDLNRRRSGCSLCTWAKKIIASLPSVFDRLERGPRPNDPTLE
jgi:hypothetical protein